MQINPTFEADLTTTWAAIRWRWLALDRDNYHAAFTTHIARLEMKGFDVTFIQSSAIQRLVGSNEDHTPA